MYYIFRKLSITIAIIGFIILLGVVGTSDLEVETHQQIMSDSEFYTRLVTGVLVMGAGTISYTYNNYRYLIKLKEEMLKDGKTYSYTNTNYEATRYSFDRRTSKTY